MSKQRIEKLRIPRNGTGRHRSLAGGLVIGDYVDATNGERVLTVEKVSITSGKKITRKQKPEPGPRPGTSLIEDERGGIRGA